MRMRISVRAASLGFFFAPFDFSSCLYDGLYLRSLSFFFRLHAHTLSLQLHPIASHSSILSCIYIHPYSAFTHTTNIHFRIHTPYI
ncbi:hypothetical protein B0H16DRAFT_1564001, partial [Mycena metata]